VTSAEPLPPQQALQTTATKPGDTPEHIKLHNPMPVSGIDQDLPLFKTPNLWRRMACWIYEGVLLFGVVMIAGYLFSSLTQQRHALIGRHGLQAFIFLVLGIYFVWFWSHGGQTVAMKAWQLQLIEIRGSKPHPVGQARALLRYVLSWAWWLPALVLLGLSEIQGGLAMCVTMLVGVVAYALLSHLHPQKQFWHDVVCGTRLVTKPIVSRQA
jgi:uncharacterized RDD family membrane protein YckC